MRNANRIVGYLEAAGAKGIRDGREANVVCCCPFHEDRHASFSMRVDNGLFVCYSGSCGVSGNLITFLINALGWSYPKALKAHERLDIPTLEDPAVFSLPDYGKRHEVEVEEATVTEGQLGLYDFCPKYLIERGFKKSVLKDWEIGYDYGSSRVVIPVRGKDGNLAGLTKRATNNIEPRYLHLGYSKGKHLYGGHRFKAGSTVVLVEGHLDAVAWDQAFVRGISKERTDPVCPQTWLPLSTMGTRVTNEQIRLVTRFAGNQSVFIAFDYDADGIETTLRVGERLQRLMPRDKVFVFWKWPTGAKDIADMLNSSWQDRHRFVNSCIYFGEYQLRAMLFNQARK